MYDITFIIPAAVKKTELYAMTLRSAESLIESCDKCRIIIITNGQYTLAEKTFKKETESKYIKVLHVNKFNLNAIFNLGAKKARTKYVALANNDLFYRSGWYGIFTELRGRNDVIIPATTRTGRGADLLNKGREMPNELKAQLIQHPINYSLSIWRRRFLIKNKLDERFGFLGQDNAAIKQILDVDGKIIQINTCGYIEHRCMSTRLTLTKKESAELNEEYAPIDAVKYLRGEL